MCIFEGRDWCVDIVCVSLKIDITILFFCILYQQWNGQVETDPEILLVYRTHQEMIVHKISAADTLCRDTKNITQSLNSQLKFVRHGSTPSGCVKHCIN